jgi:bifunctional DNase/RNase
VVRVKHVDLAGLLVEAESGTPLVLLREQEAPYRVVPIVIGGVEAAAIAVALADETPARPATHDTMIALVESLDAQVERVEVTDVRDGAFVAELTLAGPMGVRRLDSRPSDALALAVRVDAPVFVSEHVLDEVGTVLSELDDDDDPADDLDFVEPFDGEDVDRQVASFRSFLRDVDPEAFGGPSSS